MSEGNHHNSNSSTSTGAQVPTPISIDMVIQMSLNLIKDDVFNGSLTLYICALAFVFSLSASIEIWSIFSAVKPARRLSVFCEAGIYAARMAFVYILMLWLSVMSKPGMFLAAAVAGHGLGYFVGKMEEVAAANKATNLPKKTGQVGS